MSKSKPTSWIVIRFGLWRRLWHGKYEYQRIYLGKLPLPLCVRRRCQDSKRPTVLINKTKCFGLRADAAWEKRKAQQTWFGP